jgi:hypothetical protein
MKNSRKRIDAIDVSEHDLETWTCERAKEQKYKTIKFYSPVDTGWMDRIFLSPRGCTIWAEFKKPSGKRKALQRENGNWLIRHDHYYFLLDTADKCRWFVDKVLPTL